VPAVFCGLFGSRLQARIVVVLGALTQARHPPFFCLRALHLRERTTLLICYPDVGSVKSNSNGQGATSRERAKTGAITGPDERNAVVAGKRCPDVRTVESQVQGRGIQRNLLHDRSIRYPDFG
jgi:hypothetical protein